jgi:hypothetical protein
MINVVLFVVSLVGAVVFHGRAGEVCAFLTGFFGMRALRAARKWLGR